LALKTQKIEQYLPGCRSDFCWIPSLYECVSVSCVRSE